ncbi:ABC transporter ATP-binding protein [Butyrivibrio sp. INlla16]|uniref:ABC transporter ATP-binding protein n=1 Tax=Butyrivibrio sp. INlla16 TaxID=1520807 RepID=UPI00088D2543|nr:ABC transporter ATP-binding protein [Butyrivibrio sp. INlla16]SDB49089.1 oligopeptide transport system ATP-binding protein [Butyrivibrio sp. INlla16]
MIDRAQEVLKISNLDISISMGKEKIHAIRGLDLILRKGETVALVGESGSGKSITMKAVMGILPEGSIINKGSIILKDGEKEIDILKQSPSYLRTNIVGKRIAMIFQDPMSSLNPKKKIKDIVGAGLDIHKLYSSMEERDGMISEVLETVGLSKEQAERYPGQFSGGQRQRVGIARALIMKPKLIVADECIAALDASVQAQIVNMISRICRETGTAFLFISHDLSMVRYLCQRIGVLHRGYLLETGEEEEIFKNPAHPYTRNLLAANPIPNPIVQFKKDEHYDYETSGILYENGFWHDVNGNEKHKVWCTDSEFEKWGLSI